MRLTILVLLTLLSCVLFGQNISNEKADGYKAIWFELNEKYKHGDKYSGALGTYTAKHTPLAIYSEEVNKTFFVYGGTRSEKERHLLCMIGEFDHSTGMLSRPTIVHDKEGINDPHDNPSIMIDRDGYIFVFVSGRGKKRAGYKYQSRSPFDIKEFVQISEEELTYPQPWSTNFGSFHFFTKYTGNRLLYFETSRDGLTWSEDKLLAAISAREGEFAGHYQTSSSYDKKVVGTFFNRHPNGIVNKRTDLYYVQSKDFGKTWTTADGREVKIPIKDQASQARVTGYAYQSKNVYLKDMGYDAQGRPACLYIRSNGYEPGPESEPYEWCVSKWNGDRWETAVITNSDHNYDMGSLYIEDKNWFVVGPTEAGPQLWGVGGEIRIWKSSDAGLNWEKYLDITENSKLSHSYVRRPLNYEAPFAFFWADGHSHNFSRSSLYFADFKGNVWQMPYHMTEDYQKAVKIK